MARRKKVLDLTGGQKPAKKPTTQALVLPAPARAADKSTKEEAKIIISGIVTDLAPKVRAWIEEVAKLDPAKAADLVIKLTEYGVPKLARMDVNLRSISDAELLAELERREAAEQAKRRGEVEVIEGEVLSN
jgi:hypothetical protein